MLHALILAVFFLLLFVLFFFVSVQRYFKKRKERQIALLRQFHNRLFAATSEILSKAEQIDLASKYVSDKPAQFDQSIRLTCSELVVLTDVLQKMQKDIDQGQIKLARAQMLTSATAACRLSRELNSIAYVQDAGRS